MQIKTHLVIIFLSLQLISASRVTADTDRPVLYLPVDCVPGESCFIQNYVDVDPTPAYKDYTCGFLSYNDHKGTDFRLPNLEAMEKGVKVLAAAPGVVRATRDSMPDINIKKIDPSLIEGREAGNSVAIQHGHGWETQYSHLRKGSVVVKSGQKINTGDVLGLIGMSGNTEFPHMHFSVRHHGKTIDPFTGLPRDRGCGLPDNNPLWDVSVTRKLEYQPSGILEAGFTDYIPEARPLHEYLEKKNSLPITAKRIIFWIQVFGIRKDDIQQLEIISLW